ncbi:MAG: GNAT family N-acetyltransferase [Scytonematopsis contorta HA4267-MV1]|jgi:ribosomal protein S18 acetylase RimI-like enzyme|nr:GNAT family N-acetyltransferase [Scytonematopsis contorta HA4267-MV1]
MLRQIKPFTAEYIDDCAWLFLEVFNSEPWNEKWTFANAVLALQQILNTPNFIGFIWQEDMILGFVLGCCEPTDTGKRFFLKEICVKNNQQRQGIGSQLLSYLTQYLVEIDVKLIYLLTRKNSNAEFFYSKQGFVQSSIMTMMVKHL